ncbi:MAG: DegT/DnrJ/EryC1/StrS family aminotransferase [Verrucomicrobia bacterium]|nr:DegT/DnrJ/EryC1/StrS family aminotransferase [Verrucomicrobiota bacterium]
MPVPLLDVNAQNHPLELELTAAFARVLRSGRFILGEEVEAFEAECAAFIGAGHAVSMSSGTDALLAALMVLGLGPGDEVLCPAFTFFATAGSIARTGAIPVFCDVCPVTFNLDLESAAARLTLRTKAIMPVHLFGQAAEMEAMRTFATAHRLRIIEDVAQAIGATYHGRSCGTLGDLGCFSFFPSKNLGGFGDGGLVTTADADLAEKLRRTRNHGMHPRYHHATVGANFRMDALQCALLRVKLRHLGEYAAGRAANAKYYLERISRLPGVVPASAAEGGPAARIVLPLAAAHLGHGWNQFTLRLPATGHRDALKSHLTARGIGCEIYYPVALHQQECFKNLPPHAIRACPVSEVLTREVLSIPVYAELTGAQLDEVIAAIAGWLEV